MTLKVGDIKQQQQQQQQQQQLCFLVVWFLTI
jgi:hypothetical protein